MYKINAKIDMKNNLLLKIYKNTNAKIANIKSTKSVIDTLLIISLIYDKSLILDTTSPVVLFL